MSIKREIIEAMDAVGAGFDAVATATSGNIQGIVHAVYLEFFTGKFFPDTDVTIYEDTNVSQEILTVLDNPVDQWYYPMTVGDLNSTGASITNQGQLLVFQHPLTLTLYHAVAGNCCRATIVYESNTP